MKRLSYAVRPLLLSVLALGLGVSMAGAVLICEGDTNPERYPMTDYHVVITSKEPITDTSGVLSDDGALWQPSMADLGNNQTLFNWYMVDAPPGDSIGFCVRFKVKSGSYSVEKNFTAVKGYVEIDLPVLGAELEEDGEYSLTNAYEQPIQYMDYQYLVQPTGFEESTEELAGLMEEVAAGLPFEPGWNPIPDGVVPPEGAVAIPVGIAPGDEGFLLSCVRTAFEDGEWGTGVTIQEMPLSWDDDAVDGELFPNSVPPVQR